MDKNLTKGLIAGIAITGILLYVYFKQKNDAIQLSYDQQLKALQDKQAADAEAVKNSEEFVALNQDCELIGQFKAALNFLLGSETYDNSNIFDQAFKSQLDIILANTTHFTNSNNEPRKSFLYDINLTVANIHDFDIPPRSFNYEYTPGVISLGDKGNDVSVLQALINDIYEKQDYPTKLQNNSTYDKETATAVTKMFAGTTALIDNTKGTISKEFVNNLTTIISNLIKI